MEQKNRKCGICLVDRVRQVWFPFRREFWFSVDEEDFDAKDSVDICERCTSRIYKIKRTNGEAFSECVTVADVCQVVRKAFRL